MGWRRGWSCRSGEQEASRARVGIDRPAHEVPGGREALPLIDQDRWRSRRESFRCGTKDLELARVVQSVRRGGAALCGLGLADRLRTFEGNGGQSAELSNVSDGWAVRSRVPFAHHSRRWRRRPKRPFGRRGSLAQDRLGPVRLWSRSWGGVLRRRCGSRSPRRPRRSVSTHRTWSNDCC